MQAGVNVARRAFLAAFIDFATWNALSDTPLKAATQRFSRWT